MSNISESLFEAMDIIVNEMQSKLQYDRTVKATVVSLVNAQTGEYKVNFNGNIFSAFAATASASYSAGDIVYVTVPEGDFSNRKIITATVNTASLTAAQLNQLANTIIDISPNIVNLGYEFEPENTELGYGLTVGAHERVSILTLEPYSDDKAANQSFRRYADGNEYIQISGDFLTTFFDEQTSGDYGLEVGFYIQDKEANNYAIATYRLSLDAFNGDPYHLVTYSPQSIVIQAQKSYLLGVAYIAFYETGMDYDYYYALDDQGEEIKDDTTKVLQPNIFVRNVQVKYVEKQDLTNANYYLYIAAPVGVTFTKTGSLPSLVLRGHLIYKGEELYDSSACRYQWYKRDLSIMSGSEGYNSSVGVGWKKIEGATGQSLYIYQNEVPHSQAYKLVMVYQDFVTTMAEATIYNANSSYEFAVQQNSSGNSIQLQLVQSAGDEELTGDWYVSQVDGSYSLIANGKTSIDIQDYLEFSGVRFYCAVKLGSEVLDNLEYQVSLTETQDDLVIEYQGEQSFRYDVNGDIAIEDSERERLLQAKVNWKNGIGASYRLDWIGLNGQIIEPGVENVQIYSSAISMISSAWVDSTNILHYTIQQKYKFSVAQQGKNNIGLRVTMSGGKQYFFEKEILFLKDGDQSSNGTTYVAAIRPHKDGVKVAGFQPLFNDNSLDLKCFVYRDGEEIYSNQGYTIKYRWEWSNTVQVNMSVEEAKQFIEGKNTIQVQGATAAAANYVKVSVAITLESGTDEIVTNALYPIDYIVGSLDKAQMDLHNLPFYIQYTSNGNTPSFYEGAIHVYYGSTDYVENLVSLDTQKLNIYTLSGGYYLAAAPSLKFEDDSTGILKCEIEDAILYHTIIMYLDTTGNETITGWDGTSIDIGDGSSYIFAPQFGVGGKNSSNLFSGVVMGKDNKQGYGLYGYRNGVNTFGLREDGRAFFGAKNSGSQILSDGKYAFISGGDAKVDLETKNIAPAPRGMYIQLADTSDSSIYPVKTDMHAIGVGYNSTSKKERFYVTYDGDVYANYANFYNGAIKISDANGGNPALVFGDNAVAIYYDSSAKKIILRGKNNNSFLVEGDYYIPIDRIKYDSLISLSEKIVSLVQQNASLGEKISALEEDNRKLWQAIEELKNS